MGYKWAYPTTANLRSSRAFCLHPKTHPRTKCWREEVDTSWLASNFDKNTQTSLLWFVCSIPRVPDGASSWRTHLGKPSHCAHFHGSAGAINMALPWLKLSQSFVSAQLLLHCTVVKAKLPALPENIACLGGRVPRQLPNPNKNFIQMTKGWVVDSHVYQHS